MIRGMQLFSAGFIAALALSGGPWTQAPPDNPELTRLCSEDQADRNVPFKQIDWAVVGKRDAQRLTRVKEIVAAGGAHSGADLYHAALVLQHSSEVDDFLLAHELCVIGIQKGSQEAIWLAAASEDRFLMNLRRPQRFGTQYRSDGPKEPLKLYQVDPRVTDQMRVWMHAPTLAEAKKRADDLNKGG